MGERTTQPFAEQVLALVEGSSLIDVYPAWRQGLSEMVRVTRSGGQVCLTMWTQQDDCSPAHLLKRVFKQVFPDRELWPANLFPVFSREMLEVSLRDAGCTNVEFRVAEADWCPFFSPRVVDECDPMFKSFPGYAALDASEAKTLHAQLKQAFGGYTGRDGGIHLPTKAFLVTGRKA